MKSINNLGLAILVFVLALGSGLPGIDAAANAAAVNNDESTYALSFDGVNDYVEISPGLALPTNFSLAVWVKPGAKVTQVILGNRQNNAILMLTGKTIRLGAAGTSFADWAGARPPDNKWHHLVVLRSNNLVELFINGASHGTRSIPGQFSWMNNDNNYLRYFGQNYSGHHFQGLLAEVRVYNRLLTTEEIIDHYNNGNGEYRDPEGNLLAGWHLDEGTGTRADDYSGNKYTGIIKNGIAWVNIDISEPPPVVVTPPVVVPPVVVAPPVVVPPVVVAPPVVVPPVVVPPVVTGGTHTVANAGQLSAVLTGQTVKPGDRILLRAGVYTAPMTTKGAAFISFVTGTASAPVTITAYPNERAIINGSFFVEGGGSVIVKDLEFAGSNTTRITSADPTYYKVGNQGLGTSSPNVKFINNIVHDTFDGIWAWASAIDTEIYGNVVYYTGWTGSDRGHGHSLYSQNDGGTKRIVDNIFLNSHGYHLHFYTEGSRVNGFHIEGNTLVNAGQLATPDYSGTLLLGSNNPAAGAERFVFTKNYTYTTGDLGLNLSYQWAAIQKDVTISENWLMGTNNSAPGGAWLKFTANKLWSGYSRYSWGQLAPQWFSSTNTFFTSRPTATEIFVRPNKYEAGRANVTVYNWNKASSVQVNLSGILQIGDIYQVIDAQNYFGPPVASGVYAGGSIAVPMTNTAISPTVGQTAKAPRHTAPEFGVFIVSTRKAP